MENDFRYFMGCLEAAAVLMTNTHYFRLPVLDMETPEFRERVYCYELYHQLRNMINRPNWPYELDGEVDKAGHPNDNVRDKKPDFIIHALGTNNNLAVVEVKAIKYASGPRTIRSGLKRIWTPLTLLLEVLDTIEVLFSSTEMEIVNYPGLYWIKQMNINRGKIKSYFYGTPDQRNS